MKGKLKTEQALSMMKITIMKVCPINQNENIVASFYSKWDEHQFNYYIKEFDLNPKSKIKTLSKGMKMKFSLAISPYPIMQT